MTTEIQRQGDSIGVLQRNATIIQILFLIGTPCVFGGVWTYTNLSMLNLKNDQQAAKIVELTGLQSRVQTVESQNKAIDKLSANFDILATKIEVMSNKQTEMATQLQQLLSKR